MTLLSKSEEHQQYRAFLDAIQPYLKIKVKIMSLAMPTWVIFPDGDCQVTNDGLTDDARKLLKDIDELIANIRSLLYPRFRGHHEE